jgi:F-type H+-transporting ATPase subunit b
MRSLRVIAGSFSVLAIALLFAAAPVFAQEGEGPVSTPAGMIFKIVNSAFVIGLIVWAFSKCAPIFRKRAEEITQKIEEGTHAREAAERQRQEIKAKLAGLETEIQQLREKGKQEAAAEASRLREAAKADAQKIEAQAKVEIAAAVRAAQLALKAATADKAIAHAEALLRQQITPQSDANLVKTFVAGLERSVN